MNLDLLPSLAALLGAAGAGLPVFIVTGRLAGQPWRLTYHAGHGVENPVVARALLEADLAVLASVRRAEPADLSAAFLSWHEDPHAPLLQRDFPAGGPWRDQARLVATLPLTRPLRDTPGVRSALDAFARHDEREWRFRGARVLVRGGVLLAYAPDEAALRALLRPLLLQVPGALPDPPEAPREEKGPPPALPRRRRVGG